MHTHFLQYMSAGASILREMTHFASLNFSENHLKFCIMYCNDQSATIKEQTLKTGVQNLIFSQYGTHSYLKFENYNVQSTRSSANADGTVLAHCELK